MVLPSLAVGGMEVMTCDLARGLSAREHQVGITCIEEEGELAELLRDSGVSVRLVGCPGVRPNFVPDNSLTRHFAALGCDVVHLHNGVWAKAALACRSARVPAIISTMHGFINNERWFNEPLRWWGARHSDVIVAVSGPLQRHLVERTRIPGPKVTVLGNGIDTDRFAPGPRSGALRSRFGIAPDVPVLGCVARLDPIKNHSMLLATLERVLAFFPETRLVLVGDGPLRETLQAQVTGMGLTRSVIFAGVFPDPAPLYRDLDAFVLASLSEGTSISILEALASGIPVVATGVGGTPDLLEGGACGLLIPSGDAVAMADAVNGILRDRNLRSQLAASGRARAVACFSHSSMVASYEDLYRSVLRKRMTAPTALSTAF
jgi:glycosyltransferase involved in cell wall biosynthesis